MLFPTHHGKRVVTLTRLERRVAARSVDIIDRRGGERHMYSLSLRLDGRAVAFPFREARVAVRMKLLSRRARVHGRNLLCYGFGAGRSVPATIMIVVT